MRRDKEVKKMVERFLRYVCTFTTWFIGYMERHPDAADMSEELGEARAALETVRRQLKELEACE